MSQRPFGKTINTGAQSVQGEITHLIRSDFIFLMHNDKLRPNIETKSFLPQLLELKIRMKIFKKFEKFLSFG